MPNYRMWLGECQCSLSRAVDRPGGPGLLRYAEAVVGVAEIGWDAAAGGAAGEFDVMAPGSSSRGSARSVWRALRVVFRGGRVIQRVVPISAPLVHVLAHVIQAVGI